MVPREETLRVGAGWEDMERGAGFSVKSGGFSATPKDPAVHVKSSWNKKNFVAGRCWVDDFVGRGPGKELDMLPKGINMKYCITGRVILFLCPRTYSHLNARVERNLTRRAHANGHTGGNSTSTLGVSAIEPPLKGTFRLQETIPMNHVEARYHLGGRIPLLTTARKP